MREQEYWQEGMDEKRFVLCVRKKIWVAVCAALCSAAMAGALYLLVRQATKGETQYRAEVLYSIGYDIWEEDEVLKEFINEYNAYTWGDMMRSDRVMESVAAQLPDVDRSLIEASVSTQIASDPEFLTAFYTTGDADLSNRIAAAYNVAMAAFGETMRGRGLTGIEAWKVAPAEVVEAPNRVLYAMELGAVIGLIAGILGLAAWYILDDSVLVAQDFEKRFPYPVFGYRTQQPDAYFGVALSANLDRQAQKGAFREAELALLETPGAAYETLRETPVVLLAEWGTSCRRLGRALHELALQDVSVLGVVLTEADGRFLRAYYGKKKGDFA